MKAYCKVCGKILRDPASIARGMGPKCAGILSSGKSFRSRQATHGGSAYLAASNLRHSSSIMSYLEDASNQVPETLQRFPADLVDLVLSAPTAGSIAERIKLHRRRNRTSDIHPVVTLKQIRRACIEFRLLFWPGLFTRLEPLPCIPCGEDDWKIGENGRVCSKAELVAYLSRYGIISIQPVN